jgi:hypothetical protein
LNPSLFSIIKFIIEVLISGDSYPKKLCIQLITISGPRFFTNFSSVLTTSSLKVFCLSLKLLIIGSNKVLAWGFKAVPAASQNCPAKQTNPLTSYLCGSESLILSCATRS